MPATTITGSSNIASLNSKILASLCTGIFYVDLTPAVWIGSGASNVQGASVKIVNPYGVTIKDYPTSGYDIYPPMTSVVPVNIPTQANNFQYGQYNVSVRLTDADGTQYTVSKTVSICAPDSANKTRNYGSLSAQLNGVCTDGKVYIIADTVPNYNGVISNSQVNAFVLEYPTGSGLANLSTTIGSFSTNLFEGVYKFTGTICANYNYGDNVSVQVNYRVKREKNIRCLLDETCLAAAFKELDARVNSDCTDAEKIATQNTIINALRLKATIEITANSGFDPSDYISELEDVLGCVCTCNCAEGTPIINNNPSGDFLIEGCNVVKSVVGLTTHYQIDNYAYDITITPNGGVLTISAPTLADCTKTKNIIFNIAPLYTQIKGQIVNLTEYNYWASILNKAWDSLDISCLGVSQASWNAYTYTQRSQIIVNRICAGANCAAQISTNSLNNSAANVTVTWVNVSGVYEVAVYLDGNLAGTVLYPGTSWTFVGAADGNLHEYKLIPKCSNGSVGALLGGSFTYFGCPAITAPTVSSSSVSDATCPYNISALVGSLPVGITAEWHNQNNTNNSSLVADPTQVTGGIYYVFGRNSNGCYSTGTQVILTCSTATACTAPQNLIVESIVGGFRVRFQSAAFPPPLNSYTVKRRLTADPDISPSYTTIGTPTWNATVSRWEILDNTPPANNTLYTYRAISNCTSSAPYVDYIFANITCPTVSLTPTDTTMGYSFVPVGGGVTKYEVMIYAADGITLIHTDTHLPAFPNPVTGTFIYLIAGTTYQVKVRVWIGTYYSDCPLTSSTTTGGGSGSDGPVTIQNATGTGTISSFAGISGMAPSAITPGNSAVGTHSAFTGSISLFFSVGATPTTTLRLFRNGSLLQTVSRIAGATTPVSFISQAYAQSDTVLIEWF